MLNILRAASGIVILCAACSVAHNANAGANECCIKAHELEPDPELIKRINEDQCKGSRWSAAVQGKCEPTDDQDTCESDIGKTSVTIREYELEWDSANIICVLKPPTRTEVKEVTECRSMRAGAETVCP